MANAIAQTLLAKRTHKVAGRGKSRAMQFGNGQILVTGAQRNSKVEAHKQRHTAALVRWWREQDYCGGFKRIA